MPSGLRRLSRGLYKDRSMLVQTIAPACMNACLLIHQIVDLGNTGMGNFRFVGGRKPDLSREPFMEMAYGTVSSNGTPPLVNGFGKGIVLTRSRSRPKEEPAIPAFSATNSPR